MRFNHILIIVIFLLGFAIIFTLKTGRLDLDNWRKGKADFQWEYVDSTVKISPLVLEVSYFERQEDIYNLFVSSKKSRVQRSEEQRTQGRYSAEIVFGTTWEEITLVHFPEGWSNYRYLKFDIYNPQDNLLDLQFRIGDYFDAGGFYLDSQKFKREMGLKKGWNRLEFSVEEISKKININSSRKTIHLSFFPQPGEKVYVDNLRLIR